MWLLEVEKPVCYTRSIDIIIITKSNDRGEKLMICCLPDWSLLGSYYDFFYIEICDQIEIEYAYPNQPFQSK